MEIKIYLLIVGVLLISSVSALEVTQENLNISKNFDQDHDFVIEVSNPENFTIYNITFEEDFVELPKFTLNQGEKKNVTVTLTRDTDYNSTLTLRGDYEINVGASNESFIVNLDYPEGLDICNLNLIKGDDVTWINNYSDTIKLINAETLTEFASINANSNFTQKFNDPIEIDYYASWIGFKFTDTCDINVQNDEGYVHSSQYDAIIPLNLKINFNPTTLTTNIPIKNYTIAYNGQGEDILTITNTGSEIAKSIHLEAQWFNFSKNDFDLNPGTSTNVGYTIKPTVIETNQTNKTHEINLKMSGNFDEINETFRVFIPFQNIQIFSDSNVDDEILQNFVKFYCAENLDACEQIYCSINPDQCVDGRISGDGTVSQRFSENAINELIQRLFELQQENEESKRVKAELETKIGEELSNLNNKTSQLESEASNNKEFLENISTTGLFLIVFILLIFCGGIVYYIYTHNLGDIRKKLKFHKGEKR